MDTTANSVGSINILVDAATPPITTIGVVGLGNIGNIQHARNIIQTFTFIVPPSYYYEILEVLVSGGTVTLNYWWEIQLISPESAGL